LGHADGETEEQNQKDPPRSPDDGACCEKQGQTEDYKCADDFQGQQFQIDRGGAPPLMMHKCIAAIMEQRASDKFDGDSVISELIIPWKVRIINRNVHEKDRGKNTLPFSWSDPSNSASALKWQMELMVPEFVGNQVPDIVGKDALQILIGHLQP